MNIGMIIYSETGNTLSVAEKLKKRLVASGHTVTIERVTVDGNRRQQRSADITFGSVPDTTPYDALVFGSPVQAFSLSLPMAGYLKQAGSLDGKQVACLVSQAFPYPWMGGNRAIRQMKKLCESKGVSIIGSGIVNWAKWRRDITTQEAVNTLSRAF